MISLAMMKAMTIALLVLTLHSAQRETKRGKALATSGAVFLKRRGRWRNRHDGYQYTASSGVSETITLERKNVRSEGGHHFVHVCFPKLERDASARVGKRSKGATCAARI